MTDTHIKIPEITPLVRLVADGEETAFEYPFPIFASEDLRIYLNGAEQASGYAIAGAGDNNGGTVTFDSAPADGVVVTLKRVLPLERLTDFLEGGDFSAASINSELDYLMAVCQQVRRENDQALNYPETESAGLALPEKALRAGKALAFDESGNPIAVAHGETYASPNFTATGTGANIRQMEDKMRDVVSVKDFGAVGDGLADDTIPIQQALAAHDNVYLPNGTYRTTATIALTQYQSILGAGQNSVIQGQNASFNVIEVQEDYCTIQNLRITGGNIGIKLYGVTRPCVQNTIRDVTVWGANIGMQLDGHNNTNYPCYWNHVINCLVAQPATHGVHLLRSGAGDTPNANKFIDVRVYSLSAPITGYGFYIEGGRYNNAFVDCEANLDTGAQACFLVGADTEKTLITNLYTETLGAIPNVQLEDGSVDTMIINLFSASAGPAIYDFSGGKYAAINAGFPTKNRLEKTDISDLTATIMRYDTAFINEAAAATIEVDGSVSYYLVSAYNGDTVMELPDPLTLEGIEITFKKVDTTDNLVTINEESGTKNPDGRPIFLGGPNDYATVLSDGAKWMIKSSNRMAGNTRYYNGTGIYDIDMAVDVYFLSSFSGALEARLPPADAPEAIGRVVTLKKTDVSANAVTITEQGGSGPDNSSQSLSSQYNALTCVSDGASWYILGTYA